MVITTIALDPDIHRRLRHLAIEDGTSFRDLIRAAIADFLTKRERRTT
ncbi:MAG TPA: ribbon-helix-helix domain-containing protein [Candidatus Binatia bacterium]|nr:ribbon-helix-helix domain-containing protein [Candidatus Binatia bacterium]